MNKNYFKIILMLLCFNALNASAASWEKLYVKKSTDCFRHVREVPAGGYVIAGYTANFTANDTDGIVLRLNANGDTLWSFIYNGPSSKEDLFYKAVPTSDGGFILCGYSKSFGSGENAIYAKLNSSGQLQWIKNWGGSGIEHAQDIIQLSDGKYVICGYTTTAPARYYDAFILKIDGSGNTIWSKIFGGTNYDDANSIRVLPDDGFIMGGQSNNQLYLIRTNSNGDSLWTKAWGTSGIDNIECVNFAQGGGFIIAGTTDGTGAGAEDAYLVKTDTGGAVLWSKTIGGIDNDGFHRIEPTSDGGYFGVGSSREGPWTNPNIWMIKMDANGNKQWENFFGGDNHDHGYSGQPTSDGGYIAVGHTHSFIDDSNVEDGMIIKTNGTGQVADLTWTTVTQLLSPVVTTCGSATAQIQVQVTNHSNTTISSIPVTVEITGAITQTLTQTLNTNVTTGSLKTLTFTTTVNMSGGGTFNFHCYTGNPHDVLPVQNFVDKSITVGGTAPPVVTAGSHCGPGTVSLSATSPTAIQWYSAASGGSSLGSGSTFTTPYLTGNTTYYAQSGGSCQSARVPVAATITAGLTPPVPTDGFHCGPGTVSLSATSAHTINWYTSNTSTNLLHTGTNYTTGSLNSNTTYYIQADNSTCTSNRVAIDADILTPPNSPSVTPGSHCLAGTVTLTATASGAIEWYDAATNGNLVGNGTSFTTPVLNNTTTFYAMTNNGSCTSTRAQAVATISSPPADPVTNSNSRCGTGTVALSATSSSPLKWYDAPSGGNLVGNGTSFTTPSISTTTTYYAVADNGCVGNRIAAVATVNPLPPAPTTTPNNRCGTGTVTLTASATNPIKWYSSASGGSSLFTGSTFTTPSISSTTTYYAAADDGCSSTRVAAVATVYSIPSNPVVTAGAHCGSGTVSLSATASSPMQWYDAASGGNQVATGNSFTTPVLSNTTTYYVLANNGNCSSSRVPVAATIATTPAAPVTTGSSRCGNGTLTLTATATNPIKWFTAASGGTQVGTGTSFVTPSISTTTTYYAMTDNVCVSNRVAAVATINSIPADPVTTSAEMCGDGSLTLSATSSDPVKWYDAASGGTQVGSGNSFNTPVLSTTTTFYVMADNGPCESNRISAIATINPLPADPIVTSAQRCGDGTLDLSAASTDSLEWYDSASGGTLVGTGLSFTTPLLSASTTYYVIASNPLCESNVISVDAVINTIPTIDIGPDTIYCLATSFTFDAGAGFSSYEWSTSEIGQTLTAIAVGEYCVTVTDANNCTASDCSYLEFTVGIENVSRIGNVLIYPNPNHGQFTIESSENSKLSLSLLDITGKEVANHAVIFGKETLDLSFLSPGIYMIRLSDEHSSAVKRLVIE